MVAWVPLPAIAAGTVTDFSASYAQNPNATFWAQAMAGKYTAAATTPCGATVPAKSVYWDLCPVEAGTTAILR